MAAQRSARTGSSTSSSHRIRRPSRTGGASSPLRRPSSHVSRYTRSAARMCASSAIISGFNVSTTRTGDGKSGDVSFRMLLHVFDIRDGKITRENVWCDLAAIQQQLGCTVC